MHFCAIHLHDLAPPCDLEEKVFVVVPRAAKTALAVPLDALGHFLPLIEQAVGAEAWRRCPDCGATIPKLKPAVCPGSQCAPPDPG